MVRIIKEYNKNFGKYVYVIVVNGQKEFFEFTKADAVKKVRKIIKMEKERKNKMVKKRLTEVERKKLLKQYNRNEARNYHTPNAVNLIKRFGTPAEKKSAIARFKKFQKSNTRIAYDDYRWFYNHGHNKYYKKLVNPIKKRRKK